MNEALGAKLPESGLKAIPNIHSRVQHFKGVHSIIHDMVVGSCTSEWLGFGDENSGGGEGSLENISKGMCCVSLLFHQISIDP